jgi:hypothetical protein
MIKTLFSKCLSYIFSWGNSLFYCVGYSSQFHRNKGVWPLLLLVLTVPCMTGCIQNDKYIEGSPVKDIALKEPSSEGNGVLKDNVPYDRSLHLDLDFLPEVTGAAFHAGGDLVLWGNTTLPYIMLNATLWRSGHLVEKAKYMLIQVEPGKKYSFDIFQNQRIAQGDYDCNLEASSPFGSLFSEKRHCLAISEPEVLNLQDRNAAGEEKAVKDVSGNSKTRVSEVEVQSQGMNQDMNSDGNGVQGMNSEVDSAGASKISSRVDKDKVLKQTKNDGTASKDSSGLDVVPVQSSKNIGTQAIRTSKPNRAATESSKIEAKDEGMFVGSTGSNKYHMPDCRFVAKIKNKLYFKSAEDARKNGKVPCKTCNPP